MAGDEPLKPGDRVCLLEGPFKNFVATVVRVEPERRAVRVELSLFNKRTPLEVNQSDLAKLK
jgi:transcriptional antiterminator NusG